jgi:hypothetical protein
LADARRVIAEDEAVSRRVAADSLRRIAGLVEKQGFHLAAARVADKARKPLPPLEKILTAHPLIHAAEGELFRQIALTEAKALLQDAKQIDSDTLLGAVATAAGISPRTATAQLERGGKAAGSPWTQEHRLCALAAWLGLLPRKTAGRN